MEQAKLIIQHHQNAVTDDYDCGSGFLGWGIFSGLLVGSDEQVYMMMISVKAFETSHALIKHHQNAVKWK